MHYNQYEIEDLFVRYRLDGSLVGLAVRALYSYMRFINENSDGWAYWSAGTAPTASLQGIIFQATDRRAGIGYGWPEAREITDDELKAAIRRIRAFCTRRPLAWQCPELEERVRAQATTAHVKMSSRNSAVGASKSAPVQTLLFGT